MEVVETIAFRVTRNADLDIDEEEVSNLMSAVELELRRRRFQQAVRLQLSRSLSADVAALLVKELELGDDDVYVTDVPLSLVDLFELVALDRPELRDPPHVP
jgi:polyphosphate kinase